MFALTDHKKVQLSENPENVCSGRLQMLQNEKWSEVRNLDPSQANVYCKQMFCGASAGYTNFTQKNAVELRCTSKSV